MTKSGDVTAGEPTGVGVPLPLPPAKYNGFDRFDAGKRRVPRRVWSSTNERMDGKPCIPGELGVCGVEVPECGC